MTFYIVIANSNGNDKAISAFSSRAKAEKYISASDIEKTRIEPYEVPKGETFSTVMMYAAHTATEDDKSEINGYFFNIYDAESAIENGGFVERLAIDQEDEIEDKNENENEDLPEPVEQFQSYKLEQKKVSRPENKSSVLEDMREAVANPKYDWFVLIAVVVLIISGNIIYHIYFYNNYDYAENVDSVDWLPKSANNISYYKDRLTDVYEFSISEPEFLNWAKAKRLEINKIEEKPFRIARYRFYSDLPIEGLEDMSEEEQYLVWKSMTEVNIENGYNFKVISDDENNKISGGMI